MLKEIKEVYKATEETRRKVAPEGTIKAIYVANPFEHHLHECVFPEWSEGALLGEYLEGIPEAEKKNFIVSVSGKVYQPEEWMTTVVTDHDVIVVVQAVHGEGGIGQILGMIAMIIIAIYAPYLVGGVAGTFAGLTTIQVVGAVAIMTAGAVLVSALTPAPKSDMDTSDMDESPSYAITGPKNTSQEGLPVPVVYGTCSVGGNVIGISVENTNPKAQTLNILVALAEGPIGSVNSITLDDININDFREAKVSTKLGRMTAEDNFKFAYWGRTADIYDIGVDASPDAISSQAVNVELNRNEMAWSTPVSTLGVVDRFRVDMLAPGGLMRYGNNGRYASYHEFEVQFRVAGSGAAWTMMRDSGTVIEMPIRYSYFSDYQARATNNYEDTVGAWVTEHRSDELDDPTDHFVAAIRAGSRGAGDDGSFYTNQDYETNRVVVGGIYGHTSLGDNLSSFQDGVAYIGSGYYSDRKVGPGWNLLGVAVSENWTELAVYADKLSISGRSSAPLRWSFTSQRLAEAQYEVRVRRSSLQEDSNQGQTDRIDWESLVDIVDDKVFYNYTAAIHVEVELGQQLNKVPNVIANVSGKRVRYIDPATGTWSTGARALNNPAWIAYDILTNTRYGAGVAPSRIDERRWADWAEYCIEADLTFDGVFDTSSTVWDSLQHVLRAGHARLAPIGTKYAVAIDRPTAPSMVFNASNILESSFVQEFLPLKDRANEVTVSFFDAADGYRKREIKVSSQEVLDGAPLRTSSIVAYGIVSAEKATREGVFTLKQAQLTTSSVSFRVPIEAMTLAVGDVFLVQHPQMQWGEGSPCTFPSGSSLKLDRPITLGSGNYRAVTKIDAATRYTTTITAIRSADKRVTLASFNNAYQVDRLVRTGGANVDTQIISQAPGYVWVKDVSALNVGNTVTLYDADAVLENTFAVQGGGFTGDTITLAQALDANNATDLSLKSGNTIIGRVNDFTDEWRCTSIEYFSDSEVQVRGINYDEDVYDWTYNEGVVRPVGDWSPSIVPFVRNLAVGFGWNLVGNTNVLTFDLTWTIPISRSARGVEGPYRGYAGAEIQVREGLEGAFRTVGTNRANDFTFEFAATSAERHYFRVVTRSTDGRTSLRSASPVVSVSGAGYNFAPGGITVASVAPLATGGVQVTWINPLDERIAGVEIRRNTVNDVALTEGAVVAGTTYDRNILEFIDLEAWDRSQGYYYWIRPRDREGNRGPWFAPTGSPVNPSRSGDGAYVGALTNASHVIAAYNDGVPLVALPDPDAGGNFVVTLRGVNQTDVTYSVLNYSGATFQINNATNQYFTGPKGAYRLFQMGNIASMAFATFRAVVDGVTLDRTFSISKTKDGLVGSIGQNAVQYYIRPINGTHIRNSGANTLTLQARKLDGSSDQLCTGDFKLYVGTVEVTTPTYLAGSTGYVGVFGAAQINNSVTVSLKDGPSGTVYDTITLADISDGGLTGFITPEGSLAMTRGVDQSSWSPVGQSYVDLNATFFKGGVAVGRLAQRVSRDTDGALTYGWTQHSAVDGELNIDRITVTPTGNGQQAMALTFEYNFGNEKFSVTETVHCTLSGVSGGVGSDATKYFIKPTNGTVIRNGNPATILTLRATRVVGAVETELTSGLRRLYVGSTLVHSDNGFAAGSDGWTGNFDITDINSSLVVLLKEAPNGTILDSITLSDLADGGMTGFIRADGPLAYTRASDQSTWNPSTPTFTDLDVQFWKAGAAVARHAARLNRSSDGLLTLANTTHQYPLNVDRVTIQTIGNGSNSVTVIFDYYNAATGDTFSIQESVLTSMVGGQGAQGANATRHYIKAINGTAIRNGVGTLTLEAHVVDGVTDTHIGSGPMKLYVGSTEVTAPAYPAGSNGYTGIFNAANINNSVVVSLKNAPAGQVYDSITLADITDAGITGFISGDPVSWMRASDQSAWSPNTAFAVLSANFYKGGACVGRTAARVNRAANGILTYQVQAHASPVNASRITILPVNPSSQAITIQFTYDNPANGDVCVISETYTTTMAGTNGINGTNPVKYYIKPLNGTHIRNSGANTLTLEARRVEGSLDQLCTGVHRLYVGNTIVTTPAYPAGSTGYTGVFGAAQINNSLIVSLKDDVGNVYDTISLADITDGGITGYIVPVGPLAHTRLANQVNWVPDTPYHTDLHATFKKGTVTVARVARRVTHDVNGLLYASTINHIDSDMGLGLVSVVPSGAGQQQMSVVFNYNNNGETFTVAETVHTSMAGPMGQNGEKGETGNTGVSPTRHYIRATNGTVIRNSEVGTRTLEARSVINGVDALSTTHKLYVGTTEVTTPAYPAGSNGYTGVFGAAQINNSVVVLMKSGPNDTVVDSITLADLRDGGMTGFISNYGTPISWTRAQNQTTWTPAGTTTTLAASFYKAGVLVGRYAQQVTRAADGTLTLGNMAHPAGANVGTVSVINTGQGTMAMTVTFIYSVGADFFTVAETVSTSFSGIQGTNGADAELFYIRPVTGTAIRNSGANILEVQVRRVLGGTDNPVTTGPHKLYVGTVEVVAPAYAAGSTGYIGRFAASHINKSVTVELKTSPTGTVLDSITLADISDGGSTGYCNPVGPLTYVRGQNQTTWAPASPEYTNLNFTFVRAGVVVGRGSRRVTRDANGILTWTTNAHPSGADLGSIFYTITPSANGTSTSMSVTAAYWDGGTDISYVNETVQCVLAGIQGPNGNDGEDGINPTRYYIRPTNGTSIRNANPATILSLQARQVVNGIDGPIVSPSTIRLYVGNTLVSGAPFASGSNGYTGNFGTANINNSVDVLLKDGPAGEVLDSITLADITDGGATGFITVAGAGLMMTRNSAGVWSPTADYTDLRVSFYKSGSVRARAARRLTRQPDGTLTLSTIQHPSGDTGTVTVGATSVSGEQVVTVSFGYLDGSNTVEVFETVSTSMAGAAGAAGLTPTVYYIKPLTGTALRAGVGTLTVEAHAIINNVDTVLTSGSIKLYVGALEVHTTNNYAAGSTGWTGVFDVSDIPNGSALVTMRNGAGGTILDSITLINVTDGAAGLNALTGSIDVTGPLAWTRNTNGTDWSPAGNNYVTLDCTFYEGSTIVGKIARRITRDANGILSMTTVVHKSGSDLLTGAGTSGATVQGNFSNALTAGFVYTSGARTLTVSERVTAVLDGLQGASITGPRGLPGADGVTPTIYYIKPTNGTAIRNSTGTITLEARNIINGVDLLCADGHKLFSGGQELSFANSYQTGSNGYTGILNAGNIPGGKRVVELRDGVGGAIKDTITVIDVTDGTAGVSAIVGSIEPDGAMVWVRDTAGTAWSPAGLNYTDLDCTFYDGTAIVGKIARRITRDSGGGNAGLLTAAVTTHKSGSDLLTNCTAVVTNASTQAITVAFTYTSGARTVTVSETISTAFSGAAGVSPAPPTIFYIKPIDGTIIRNSTGTVTLEGRMIWYNTDYLVSGNYKLYADGVEVNSTQGFPAGSTGYTGILGAGNIINGKRVVTLRNGAGTTVLDSVTVTDVTDGLAGTPGVFGSVEPDGALAWVRDSAGTAWSPAGNNYVDLDATFYEGGAIVGKIARRVYRDFSGGNAGLLTVQSTTHKSGSDLLTYCTASVVNSGTQSVNVIFTYTNGTRVCTVSERVSTVLSGAVGATGQAAPRYYIKPLDGTIIRNGSGTVTLEARVVWLGLDVLSSAQKLYSEGVEVNSTQGFPAGSTGFTGILGAGNITNGKRVVTMRDNAGSAVLDSITVADITDGVSAIIGAVEPTGSLAWVRDSAGTAWSPAGNNYVNLDATFYSGSTVVAKIARRVTRDNGGGNAGLLTVSTVTHKNLDLLGGTSVVVTGDNSQTVTVAFTYTSGGRSVTVSEKVQTVLSGAAGAAGVVPNSYYIKPLNGMIMRNGVGTLTLEGHIITGGVDWALSLYGGPVRLYVGAQEVTTGNLFATGSNGWTGVFDVSDIPSTGTVVTLRNGSGGTILDSVTLVNVVDGTNGVVPDIYYIKPLNGQIMRGGVGTLTLEAHVITGGSDNLLASGTRRLFVGTQEVTVGNLFATGSNGFTGVFDVSDIPAGGTVVTLRNGSGGTILDSVTLVNVVDGTNGTGGLTGTIDPTGPLSWVRDANGTTFTPTGNNYVTLDVSFYNGTALVAKLARRVWRDAYGTTTGVFDVTSPVHKSGSDILTGTSVVVTGQGTQAITLAFTYTDGSRTVTVSQTVTSSYTGATGSAGTNGNDVRYMFQRAAAKPPAPSGSTPGAPWYSEPPAWSVNTILWFSKATFSAAGVLQGSWSSPTMMEGTDASRQIAVRRRRSSYSVGANGYVYIHGYAEGVAADVPGLIQQDATVYSVGLALNPVTGCALYPRIAGSPAVDFSNTAKWVAYIAYNTDPAAGAHFGGVAAAKLSVITKQWRNGQWYYYSHANNTGGANIHFVSFTPTESMIVIGTIEGYGLGSAGTDFVSLATVWPSGRGIEAVGEAGAKNHRGALADLNVINTTHITDGAITAPKILAGEITVDKLRTLTTSDNLIPDGDTLMDFSQWQVGTNILDTTGGFVTMSGATRATIVVPPTALPYAWGVNAMRARNGGATGYLGEIVVRSPMVPIDPAEEYILSVLVHQLLAEAGTANSSMWLQYYDINKAEITTVDSTVYNGASKIPQGYENNINGVLAWGGFYNIQMNTWWYNSAGTQWAPVSIGIGPNASIDSQIRGKIPSNAKFVRIKVTMLHSIATGPGVQATTYIQRPRLRKMINGVTISEGSIDASKLTADVVLSNRIRTGTDSQTRVELQGGGTTYPLWAGTTGAKGAGNATFYVNSAGRMYAKAMLADTFAYGTELRKEANTGGTVFACLTNAVTASFSSNVIANYLAIAAGNTTPEISTEGWTQPSPYAWYHPTAVSTLGSWRRVAEPGEGFFKIDASATIYVPNANTFVTEVKIVRKFGTNGVWEVIAKSYVQGNLNNQYQAVSISACDSILTTGSWASFSATNHVYYAVRVNRVSGVTSQTVSNFTCTVALDNHGRYSD